MIRIPYVEGAQNRPNVLFLFSDQHNARCLSCAGHPDAKTPHLDRLAAEGVRCTHAFTQSPICTPSRMSFLSSTYPSTHGYYGLYGHEPASPLLSMFEYFLNHGYRTAALGKLHTPRYWIERHCQYVYDEFIQHPSYLEALGLHEQNDNRGYHENASRAAASTIPLDHSCEWVQVKHFKRFLAQDFERADRCSRDTPWMAWMSFARPHQPHTPSEPYASLYDPESITLPPVGENESAVWAEQRDAQGGGEFDPQSLRRRVAAYLGCLAQMNAALGLVLEELDNRGELDNTIIVYSADHGDHAGEHGLYEKKHGIRARSICGIPLIIRYPGAVRPATVTDEVAEAVDVFPTMCDLAGLQAPSCVQGTSLVPLFGEHPRSVREDALTENMFRKSIATTQYRYVYAHEGEDELYDQAADPCENTNLVRSPEHRQVLQDMRARLMARLVHARRPVTAFRGGWINHRYDENGRLDPASLKTLSPYD